MKVLKIPRVLYDKVPTEGRADWVRGTVMEALGDTLPEIYRGGGGDRASFVVTGALQQALVDSAAVTGRAVNEIFVSCLAAAVDPDGGAWVAAKAPKVRKSRAVVNHKPEPPPKPLRELPPLTVPNKKAQAWIAALQKRLAIIRADVSVGRWGIFTITGGNPAVVPYEPLDEQGLRDFGEEVQGGLVVQEVIPWEYTQAEAQAWLAARQREGKALGWVYVSGDSESLNDVQEARRRGGMRADPAMAEAARDLARVEREEEIQRQVFGRKRYYLEWAARDVERLRLAGHADIPKNLTGLVRAAVKIGWEPPWGALPAPEEGTDAD